MPIRSLVLEWRQSASIQDLRRLPRVLPFGVGIVLMIWAGLIFGGIYNGLLSPWFWEQEGGALAALGWLVLYLPFYACGFVIPHVLLLFVFLYRKGKKLPMVNAAGLNTGIALASFGCMALFVSLLTPEMAFLRAFFSYVSWWIIVVVALALALLVAGTLIAREEASAGRILVDPTTDIFCRCSACGHEWTFPSEDLRTRNIVLEGRARSGLPPITESR